MARVEDALAARALGEDRLVAFGRYQLLRIIGRGGMGQVFEAWDPQLERHVAIKLVLRGGLRATLEEARCLARLTHPNVVSVHEVGQVEDLVYIAMELVDGPDLRRWLRAAPRGWREILDVLLAAGRGLAAVHDAGLLHGDVKPGNVLIGRDGRVRVADFGLARAEAQVDEGAAVSKPELDELVRCALEAVERELLEPPRAGSLTAGTPATGELGLELEGELSLDELRSLLATPSALGHAGGTVPYMAPERRAGCPGDPAADQYSFCATAWEALFGAPPGADPRSDAPRARDRVPRALVGALRRGLQADPRARWPSMDGLCAALEQARARSARLAGRLRGVAGTLVLALTTFSVVSLGGELGGRADRGLARECEQVGQGVRERWGPPQRGALELRFASSDLPLPRSEARFVIESLDAWVEDWSALHRRACVADPEVRGCLEHERDRFEAVLELLDAESLGAARALVVELGSPSLCLDARRGPSLDAEGIGRLAELSAIERRIELAVLAGAHERAADELRRFDAALAELEAAADPAEFALRRLAVEPLRARVLTATGEAAQARLRLRRALREAEAAGHDGLRFALLLEQTRLAARLSDSSRVEGARTLDWGEADLDLDHPVLRESPSFDDLAALDGLAERIEAGPVARAELSLIRARLTTNAGPWPGAVHRQLVAELEAAGEILSNHLPQGYAELRLELALRRAQLHFAAGELDPALRAAEQAWAIGAKSREQFGPRTKAALSLAGISAALLGDCDRVRPIVEALWQLSERAGDPLGDPLGDTHANPSAPALTEVDWTLVRRACPYPGGDLDALLHSR
ncbi:MAG: serine/threonine-protein kinase [Enhygromyxa sp.]